MATEHEEAGGVETDSDIELLDINSTNSEIPTIGTCGEEEDETMESSRDPSLQPTLRAVGSDLYRRFQTTKQF
jgi:hypothetical protein